MLGPIISMTRHLSYGLYALADLMDEDPERAALFERLEELAPVVQEHEDLQDTLNLLDRLVYLEAEGFISLKVDEETGDLVAHFISQ